MFRLLHLFHHPHQTIEEILNDTSIKSRFMFQAFTLYIIIIADLLLYFNDLSRFASLKVTMVVLVSIGIPSLLWLHRWIWCLWAKIGLLLVLPKPQKHPLNQSFIQMGLKKIYPYMTAIGWLPVGFLLLIKQVNQVTTSSFMFLGFLYDVLFIFLFLALQVYSSAVGVIALQRLYGVGIGRALFGPLLARFIGCFVIAILLLLALFILRIIY